MYLCEAKLKSNIMKEKLLAIIAVILAVVVGACSSIEEPLAAGDEPEQTRAGDVTPVRTYSVAEVRTFASRALNKKPLASLRATMTPVLATSKENLDKLLSDTVAYIVNYPDKGGFAVIANDSRVNPVLAYGDSVNFSMDNPVAKAAFLDRIEGYLASQSGNGAAKDNLAQTPVRRVIIEPQITTKIGPWDPFSSVVSEHHPEFYASIPVVASVNIISHVLNKLTYEGYFYNFENINYALNQGEGYNPFDQNDAASINITKPTMTFLTSYDGAVGAICQLLYQVGEDSNTQYNQGAMPSTNWLWIRLAYNKMGLSMTNRSSDYSLPEVFRLLNQGYLVQMHMTVTNQDGSTPEEYYLKSPLGWVIDGCDVYLKPNNEIDSGSGYYHCVWGIFGESDGFYSSAIWPGDYAQYRTVVVMFGVGNTVNAQPDF